VIIELHGQGFTVTPALAGHVRRRLAFVLTRHSNRIQRCAVRVGDENGPRGGVDKFCRIRVQLLGAPVVVIEDVGTDLYDVIDRAADRAGRVVVKYLDRTHPVRIAARLGARPARRWHEPLESDHPRASVA
jgi:putative sigma-54 modulation protein